MKLISNHAVQDQILVEPNGTLFISLMKTGFIKATTRVAFVHDNAAAIDAFSVISGLIGDKEMEAPYALVFVSEVAGEQKTAIIERFEQEVDALAAGEAVGRALRRHVKAKQRKAFWQDIGYYFAFPLVVFILSMSMVRFFDSHQGSVAVLNAIMREANLLPNDLAASTISTPPSQSTPMSAKQTP